ncbi:hypothetical protein HAT2_00104 [Candidatus Similichlamydia laticola]|uniref:Uncharacterized protein n=2 Tax=Candidatus Similichlamydia laticola TaxID=2170265 RepID=A0A369KIY4_9BACT|nr:hypothetical protein HAT2_00104 [Candidatus Similichlamydia laticola]
MLFLSEQGTEEIFIPAPFSPYPLSLLRVFLRQHTVDFSSLLYSEQMYPSPLEKGMPLFELQSLLASSLQPGIPVDALFRLVQELLFPPQADPDILFIKVACFLLASEGLWPSTLEDWPSSIFKKDPLKKGWSFLLHLHKQPPLSLHQLELQKDWDLSFWKKALIRLLYQ